MAKEEAKGYGLKAKGYGLMAKGYGYGSENE